MPGPKYGDHYSVKLNHIFHEAKDRLRSVIDANEKLVDKNYIVVGFSITIATTFIWIFTSNINEISDPTRGAIISIVIVGILTAWISYFNIKTRNEDADGRQPKDILNRAHPINI